MGIVYHTKTLKCATAFCYICS